MLFSKDFWEPEVPRFVQWIMITARLWYVYSFHAHSFCSEWVFIFNTLLHGLNTTSLKTFIKCNVQVIILYNDLHYFKMCIKSDNTLALDIIKDNDLGHYAISPQ